MSPTTHWYRGRSFFELWSVAHRSTSRNIQVHSQGSDSPADCCKQVRGADGFFRQRGTENLPRLILHRSTVPGGADSELALQAVFKIADRDAAHGSPLYAMISMQSMPDEAESARLVFRKRTSWRVLSRRRADP